MSETLSESARRPRKTSERPNYAQAKATERQAAKHSNAIRSIRRTQQSTLISNSERVATAQTDCQDEAKWQANSQTRQEWRQTVATRSRAHPNQLAALAPTMFKPGQSGNPDGIPKTVREARALAKEATPKAVISLINSLDSPDDRVVVIAANSLLDRGMGKVKEEIEEPDRPLVDVTKLSPTERQQLRQILEAAAARMSGMAASVTDAVVITAEDASASQDDKSKA